MTLDFQETIIITHCSQRQDECAIVVQSHIISIHDLPAVEATHHYICTQHFLKGNSIPLENQSTRSVEDPTEKQNLERYIQDGRVGAAL